MAIKITKKGMFFSLLAIILVMLFILVFKGSNLNMHYYNQESSIQKTRYVDSYVSDLKNNFLHRTLKISSQNAMDAMLQHVRATEYIDDVGLRFNELVLKGELKGTKSPYMENHTFYNWTNKIKRISIDELGIETNITYSELKIAHDSEFVLTVSYEANITVKKENILYDITTNISENLSIVGLYEPMSLRYSDDTASDAHRKIKVFNKSLTDASLTTANVLLLMKSGDFRYTGYGPDFLMRLEGNASWSEKGYGISALINKTYIDANFGNHEINRTSIDFEFYSATAIGADSACVENLWKNSDFDTETELEYFRVNSTYVFSYFPDENDKYNGC